MVHTQKAKGRKENLEKTLLWIYCPMRHVTTSRKDTLPMAHSARDPVYPLRLTPLRPMRAVLTDLAALICLRGGR